MISKGFEESTLENCRCACLDLAGHRSFTAGTMAGKGQPHPRWCCRFVVRRRTGCAARQAEELFEVLLLEPERWGSQLSCRTSNITGQTGNLAEVGQHSIPARALFLLEVRAGGGGQIFAGQPACLASSPELTPVSREPQVFRDRWLRGSAAAHLPSRRGPRGQAAAPCLPAEPPSVGSLLPRFLPSRPRPVHPSASNSPKPPPAALPGRHPPPPGARVASSPTSYATRIGSGRTAARTPLPQNRPARRSASSPYVPLAAGSMNGATSGDLRHPPTSPPGTFSLSVLLQ
jgi:hypothetical protein